MRIVASHSLRICLLVALNTTACITSTEVYSDGGNEGGDGDDDGDADGDGSVDGDVDVDADADVDGDSDGDGDGDSDGDGDGEMECVVTEGSGAVTLDEFETCEIRSLVAYIKSTGDDGFLSIRGFPEDVCCADVLEAERVLHDALRALWNDGEAVANDDGVAACEGLRAYYTALQPFEWYVHGSTCHLYMVFAPPYELGEFVPERFADHFTWAQITHNAANYTETALELLDCSELTDYASFSELEERVYSTLDHIGQIEENAYSSIIELEEGTITISGDLEAPMITGEALTFRDRITMLTTTGSMFLEPEICQEL